MKITSVTSIYFSPTGTTKRIINSIVKGMGIANNTVFDITNARIRNSALPFIEDDIVIIGVPVYEERIPEMLLPFLRKLKGDNKPIVLVAVYGNFGEGITLNELEAIAKCCGFKVVAAGTFIGEHSFSTKEVPVQEGRPNVEDLNFAEEFGSNIINKLKAVEYLDGTNLKIPEGKLPLMAKLLPKNSARFFTRIPLADMSICNNCGVCSKLCPMNAIDKDTLLIDGGKCIRCFSCVKRCPKKARKINYRPKLIVTRMLKAKNKINKENKIFL